MDQKKHVRLDNGDIFIRELGRKLNLDPDYFICLDSNNQLELVTEEDTKILNASESVSAISYIIVKTVLDNWDKFRISFPFVGFTLENFILNTMNELEVRDSNDQE